jgi:hypothetical protein
MRGVNNKTIFLVVAIAATMATGIGATMASTVAPAVYADKDTTKNDFGQGASQDLAKDGEMGDHASDPNGDGTPGNDNQHDSGDNNHRSGIGNVLNSGDPKDDPDSKHPSDLFHALCPPGSTATQCNPNP